MGDPSLTYAYCTVASHKWDMNSGRGIQARTLSQAVHEAMAEAMAGAMAGAFTWLGFSIINVIFRQHEVQSCHI